MLKHLEDIFIFYFYFYLFIQIYFFLFYIYFFLCFGTLTKHKIFSYIDVLVMLMSIFTHIISKKKRKFRKKIQIDQFLPSNSFQKLHKINMEDFYLMFN